MRKTDDLDVLLKSSHESKLNLCPDYSMKPCDPCCAPIEYYTMFVMWT